MYEIHDDIIKAQSLFHKMVGSCGPKCFKKLFTDAISYYTLDEFYPIVVRAELTAALALSAREKDRDGAFNLHHYLHRSFGLTPQHLLGLNTRTIADIMEKPMAEIDGLLQNLGFIVRNGTIDGHADAARHPFKRKRVDKSAA